MRQAILRTVGMGLLLACVAAFSAATCATARAQCAPPYEFGWWTNYDANTRNVTWAWIDFRCNDVSLNGQRPAGDPYTVSLWGACSPSDCHWGAVGGRRDAEGWIRATYYHGFATRHVWIRGYPGYGIEWLRIYIHTDFHDGRADYATDNWMVR